MNRKLIRPTLAQVKSKAPVVPTQPARPAQQAPKPAPRTDRDRPSSSSGGSAPSAPAGASHQERSGGSSSSSGSGGGSPSSSGSSSSVSSMPPPRKRQPPIVDTYAELYYYKKQIDAHTEMVIVLQSGEEISGTIEWYDRGALKINRRGVPNIMLLRHNIKYMFKAEDRDGDFSGGEIAAGTENSSETEDGAPQHATEAEDHDGFERVTDDEDAPDEDE